MASRRKLKEYALLSLQSCTKLVELLRVCQVVCLVACLVMLAMLKVVQDQQLKKSIKSDLLDLYAACEFICTLDIWSLGQSVSLSMEEKNQHGETLQGKFCLDMDHVLYMKKLKRSSCKKKK